MPPKRAGRLQFNTGKSAGDAANSSRTRRGTKRPAASRPSAAAAASKSKRGRSETTRSKSTSKGATRGGSRGSSKGGRGTAKETRRGRNRRDEDEDEDEEAEPVVAPKKSSRRRGTAAAAAASDDDEAEHEDEGLTYPAQDDFDRSDVVPPEHVDASARFLQFIDNLVDSEVAGVKRAFKGRDTLRKHARTAVLNTGEAFKAAVHRVIADRAAKVDLLSPGGSRLVNPQNTKLRRRQQELQDRLQRFQAELQEAEGADALVGAFEEEQGQQAAAAVAAGGEADAAADAQIQEQFRGLAGALKDVKQYAEGFSLALDSIGDAAGKVEADIEEVKRATTKLNATLRDAFKAYPGVDDGVGLVRALTGAAKP